MNQNDPKNTVKGVAQGTMAQPNNPGFEHQQLEMFIGKWINQGQTVAAPNAPALRIVTSDTYEWMPGKFFVIHHAYGLIGDMSGGGLEVIGYDPASKKHYSNFYDSQGNASRHEIVIKGNTCTWQGKNTRCTAVFTDNNRVQTAHHERLDESGNWVPSMEIVLIKVA